MIIETFPGLTGFQLSSNVSRLIMSPFPTAGTELEGQTKEVKVGPAMNMFQDLRMTPKRPVTSCNIPIRIHRDHPYSLGTIVVPL